MAQEISIWVPVISSLCGGFLSLLGAFGNSLLNQRKTERLSKEDRERKNLEEIYVILHEIRKDYYNLTLNQVSNKIFNNVEIKSIESHELNKIPPLIKLDMLINLYFPSLKDVHSKLVITKNIFGEELGVVMLNSYTSKSLEDKQQQFSKFWNLMNKLEENIKEIQDNIVKIIKP
ncbi:hypothetical protein [Pseudanabaena sp. lw0831]|uniref:hypothetical protein n=1 Tax=Pseudanabaena sp. lw0831 TaxID=1357935 RepID=UPI0019165F3D|nr:hypothetical protein [Pseudanabaena sp. lw0831]